MRYEEAKYHIDTIRYALIGSGIREEDIYSYINMDGDTVMSYGYDYKESPRDYKVELL